MAEVVRRDEYRCLICTELYRDPRQLFCGHTFCCQCLSSYIDAEYVTEDDRLYFPCPVCEAPILHDDVNTDVSTWAICFPKNDLLTSPTSQPSSVHLCAPCSRGQESIPADVMCTDCNENLCTQCRIHHERSKASASHHLTSISGEVGLLPDVTVFEICHRHGGKPFDVYCVDHSAICCGVCVSVSHRQCNNIKPIESVIKKTTAEMPPVETEWKELTEETKKMIDEVDVEMAVLNAKETEVLTDVTNKIQKAKVKLNDLKAILHSEVADKFKKCREQLLSQQKFVNAFLINAENSRQLMSGSDQQLSERRRFFLREQTKVQISGHYRRMDQNIKKKTNKFDIKVKLDVMIDEIMKRITIGNVDVTSSRSPVTKNANDRIGSLIGTLHSTSSSTNFGNSTSTSDIAGNPTVQTTPVTTAVDVWTGSVSCVHTVNASTLGGVMTPGLMGGIITDNNELLITDHYNHRLLLFDDNYSYKREYQVNGPPTDIARGRTADEIFVAVQDNLILRCKRRYGQLSVTTSISIRSPHLTWGIAVLGENILVDTSNSVNVMSVDGKVTKSIKKDGHGSFLAVSSSNSTVYHRDRDDVVCRRLDSDREVYRYRDPGLRNPRGIGLDRDHNVYVCCKGSDNVYLISSDGSRGRVLLPKLSGNTGSNPCGIVVHPTKQEFVVTSLHESTALEVYRFSHNNS